MIRRGQVLAATVAVLALVQAQPALAGSGDDPGLVWHAQVDGSDGAVEVGAQQKVVDEYRPRSAGSEPRPAIVSRTEYVAMCGTPADSIPATEVSGRSISCEAVPCVTAAGRAGEKRFAVTKRVEVATGHAVGAAEMGPVRCVALSPAPVSLDELVRRQFREVRLPGSTVRTEPANWTLVNYPTAFVAEQPWTQRDLGSVLGRRVSVTITPVAYRWSFGDGTAERADDGAVDHTYAGSGTRAVSVETTYRATYRVAGGRARTIPGTVAVPGPVTSLDVFEARSQLVAGPRG